uniref:CULT domain-containing protein n=1 Tax=Strongyloides stercoralis TaxID=6248 RepID=A0A0K0DXF9_STRER
MADEIQNQEEDDTLIHWQQQSSYEIMTDEFWDNFPHLINETMESFTCYDDDIDKREDDGNLYRPIDYFTSQSFDSWCKHFDECNSFVPAQYDLRDGDEVWCYKVQTTDFIPIGFEITIPYNFISEKNYFDEKYAEKYGRIVAFRNGTTIENGCLTLGHVIAIERGTEKPYDRRMVLVRTHGYGQLTNDTLESWIFKKYKIKNHYHYITYYHRILDFTQYENEDHIRNCLRCDDCYYEIARVMKNEWNIDLPLRTIVDGIIRKSMEVYIPGLINYSSDLLKDIIKRWYFMYDPYQLMVKIFCNFRELDDFTGSRSGRFQLYTKPHEFMRRFNIFINEEMIVRNTFKCYRCSADLFKVDDVECFSNEGTTLFRVNPHGEIHQLRTFKNCVSGAVCVTGLPNPSMTYFEGYKWRFLHCKNCQRFLGWRFESRVFTPSIFYAVLDRSIYPSSSAFTGEDLTEMGEIWQRNRTLCTYYFTRNVRDVDDERPPVFDDTDVDFLTSEFEDHILNRLIESPEEEVLNVPTINRGVVQFGRDLNRINLLEEENQFQIVNLDIRNIFENEIIANMEQGEDEDVGMIGIDEEEDEVEIEEDENELVSLHGSESIDVSDSVNDDSSSDVVMDDIIAAYDNNSETNSVGNNVMFENDFGENEDTRSKESDSDSSNEMERDDNAQINDNSDGETRSGGSDNEIHNIYENDHSDIEDTI